MKTAGYSGSTLTKKLGLKSNQFVQLVNQPDYYFDLFLDFPEGVKIIKGNKSEIDLIHYFEKTTLSLLKNLPAFKKRIKQNGMIWVSWPKKSSKVKTDITEDTIRNLALQIGLVDVKVCAVDDVWSALKLVIPVKERNA